MSKKVKSVAFQTADPYELALYTHAMQHKYFSTYIKRLIARDMEQGQQPDLEDFYKAAIINDLKNDDEESENDNV